MSTNFSRTPPLRRRRPGREEGASLPTTRAGRYGRLGDLQLAGAVGVDDVDILVLATNERYVPGVECGSFAVWRPGVIACTGGGEAGLSGAIGVHRVDLGDAVLDAVGLKGDLALSGRAGGRGDDGPPVAAGSGEDEGREGEGDERCQLSRGWPS